MKKLLAFCALLSLWGTPAAAYTPPLTATAPISISSSSVIGIKPGTGATGTGNVVFSTSPTLVTPALGTPASGSLSNTTGIGTSNMTAVTGVPSSATFLAGNGAWVTPPGTGITSITAGTGLTGGTITTSGTIGIATSGVSAASYGSATTSPAITINAEGQITVAANDTITPPIGSITGLGTGVATFLATPSSANLLSALTTSTGTGNAVFSASPTLSGTVTAGSSTWSGSVAIGTTNPTTLFQVGATPTRGNACNISSTGVMTNCTYNGVGVNSTGDVTFGTPVGTTVASTVNAIQGTTVLAPTGIGAVVLATSPQFTSYMGVGTAAPTSNTGIGTSGLAVWGSTGAGGMYFGSDANVNYIWMSGATPPSSTNFALSMGAANTNLSLNTAASSKMYFNVNNTRVMAMNSTGGLGIGTSIADATNILGAYGSATIGRAYQATAAPTDGLLVLGNVGIGTANPLATLHIQGTVKTLGYTVGTLPSGVVGMMTYVTDQLTTCAAAGAALTGGGAVTCPVFYNGSAWVGL